MVRTRSPTTRTRESGSGPPRTCICARSAVGAMKPRRFIEHLRRSVRLEKSGGQSQDVVTVL